MSTPTHTPAANPPSHPHPAKRRPSSHSQAQPQLHQHPSQPTQPPPTPKKPPLHTSPTSTIADTSLLTGTYPITLAALTIIHPRAKLISTYGGVEIGEGCVVCERASVGILSAATGLVEGVEQERGQAGGAGEGEREGEGEGVRLGRGVVIEAGAVVEAREVGEGTVVEVGARVGRGCLVGKHCKLGPLTTIAPYETVPDYTVVYGAGNAQRRRVDKSGFAEARMKVGERHVEVLRGLVPSVVARVQ